MTYKPDHIDRIICGLKELHGAAEDIFDARSRAL